MGMRLVEDFFAKSGVQRCVNLRETAETISKVGVLIFISWKLCTRRWPIDGILSLYIDWLRWQIGFKMFLNITPTVVNWTNDNKQFSLIFDENPLADFVELPDDGRAQDELWYSNILCGILRGALEMVSCCQKHQEICVVSLLHYFPSSGSPFAVVHSCPHGWFSGREISPLYRSLREYWSNDLIRYKCKSRPIMWVISSAETTPQRWGLLFLNTLTTRCPRTMSESLSTIDGTGARWVGNP